MAIIDSIHTLWSDQLTSTSGSVVQVRECAAQLTRLAKQSGITVILVGHVAKEGSLAVPRVLEHIVDTVLYFEGDTHLSFRLIRAVKNRYASFNEIGVFVMTDKGLKGVMSSSMPSVQRTGSRSVGAAVHCAFFEEQGLAKRADRLRRDWSDRRNPSRAARSGTFEGSRQAGVARAMIHETNKPKHPIDGIEVITVRRVEEAVECLRELD